MFDRFSSRSAAVVALAAAGLMMIPAAASAQAYGYQGQARNYASGGYGQPYNYNRAGPSGYADSCVQGRQTAGGLVGATVGAIAGSQIAARGRRTEGSILGGVLGAVVGASVGNSSAQGCDSRYGQGGYSQNGYGQPAYGSTGYGATGYGANGYGSNSYGYDNRDQGYGRDDRRYDDRRTDDRRYDGYGQPVRDARYQNTDECRLAESRIRLPDGRDEVRYVRTCPDQNGRYRVVD
ncbi:glycine zipper 2TM domain-containing protein [Brevundimonas sp.]|uniref:glycine zipper 2TM domain-containing protein n=1 Tax=Brevundimonas sp. TaxID=1871086 RepID=UPI002489B142|nr:glycine zipper 2TM domain-containing protein [Brevundimonas sp.]MDI1280852.1 glycine zipper 2TM domain-containing protein [Brevundimonas sp.]